MDLRAGEKVDRYVVEERLGEGGMAVVYRVRHELMGTWHALKVLAPSYIHVRDRLLQEGRIQASLLHPNVVRVTDIIDVGGSPGLVMDIVPGQTLEGLILEAGRLPIAEVDRIMRAILSGVAAAHALGIVHRDLKPANVLLAQGPDGPTPRVADFGLAKVLHAGAAVLGSSASRTGIPMGTPCYMAPEQIRDAKNVDHRADVFALGAMAYELLSGMRAFHREDILETYKAVATGERTPIGELCPDAPARMLATIDRALEVDGDWRWQTVEEMAAGWSGLAPAAAASREAHPATLPVPAASPASSAPTRLPSPASETVPPSLRPRSPLVWVGALAVLLVSLFGALAAVGIGYAWMGSAPVEAVTSVVPEPVDAVAVETMAAPEEVVEAVAEAPKEAPAAKAASRAATERPRPAEMPTPTARPEVEIIVNSRPWSRTVTVDGVAGSKTPFKTRMTEGPHRVTLLADDGRTVTRDVEAAQGLKWCWDFDLGQECER